MCPSLTYTALGVLLLAKDTVYVPAARVTDDDNTSFAVIADNVPPNRFFPPPAGHGLSYPCKSCTGSISHTIFYTGTSSIGASKLIIFPLNSCVSNTELNLLSILSTVSLTSSILFYIISI